ncbi:MAG TPA: DoxX family membrane protein [Acidisphaera sp.]|nr:DoxX family membrane protein [Acidisphaera sp.]
MRPSPWNDFAAFMTKLAWYTPVYWVLLAAALAIAVLAWRRLPAQRSAHGVGILVLRLLVGGMWWEQSLWKVPPNYDGLLYWMKQMTEHAAVVPQGQFVADAVIPNIALFGPLVYLAEVAIGVSLTLGLFSRLGALAGLLMALNLWLGLYSAPNEWPWTYGFLIIIQGLFLIDPPGRWLGADALLRVGSERPRLRRIALVAG